jgi:hypothetical protein
MTPRLIVEKETESSLCLRTDGLLSGGRDEVAVCADIELREEAEKFLFFVADYLAQGNQLRPDETMAYGFWLTKFRRRDENTLETWEYNPQATDFQAGATQTLRYWKDQHRICLLHRAAFSPPRPDRLTVISEGVREGLPVQGIRYPSPEHMSGWWITTDLYNGDTKSLMHEHTYHLTAARPDLAKYLALPEGYRFDLSAGEDVWRDDKVIAE